MGQRTCELCDEPLKGRQTRFCCKRHQRRVSKREARERGARWAQNAPTASRQEDLTCSHCSNPYRGYRSTGPEHKRSYCSPECLAEGHRWQKVTRLECVLPWRDCEDCSLVFYERGNLTQRCTECRRRRELRVWYMGWCLRDGKPFVTDQPAQRSCSDLCARRYHKSMRRVRQRNAHSETVHTLTVYERDDWTCRLCRKPVDRDAAVPEHLAPTLDHIVPLALGGDHTYVNVQCAHFICNARKSDTLEGQLHFAA